MSTMRLAGCVLALATWWSSASVRAADPSAPPAVVHTRAALKEQADANAEAMRQSPFGRPMTLQSTDADNTLRGDVLVEIDQPFERLKRTFQDPSAWCDVLLYTPNIAGCRVEDGAAGKQLTARLSRKYDQVAKDAYAAAFAFRVPADEAGYFFVQLTAAKGPAGTHDYRFDVEAMPLDEHRSVLRMSYQYSYGVTVRLATAAYLATTGSKKIGFTKEPTGPGGQQAYVGGMRGSVERNAMRYELGIEVRAAQDEGGDGKARFEKGLDAYLAAIGKYPDQLGEQDMGRYRQVKLEQFGVMPPG